MSAAPDLPTIEQRLHTLEMRASASSDSVAGVRSQMIEALARIGRVEASVGEIREDLDSALTSLRGISEALAAVRAAGDERAHASAEQSARILDLLGRAIDGRTAVEQARISAGATSWAELARQAAPILGAIGGLAGALAAAYAATR